MQFIPHVIDGQEAESVSGARFTSVDPWLREPYAEVALGGPEDADRAVRAARRAFDEGPWPRMGFTERGALLHRFADLIEANADALALADTTDMGKPVSDARGRDVPRAAANYRFFADHARLATGDALPMDSGHHAYTRFEPAGVVAAIAPWNFPLMLESWKVAPALAWGNTVVLKPAEDSPASAALMASLALAAGLPPGVLNVLHGYGPGSAGAALTEHPGVDRITFTGESATGRVIAGAAAANLVPVSLELGGKGANIVFDDADLGNAVTWSDPRRSSATPARSAWPARGCTSSAVSTPSSLDRFTTAAQALVTGDPKDEATQLGPLASEEHYKKVRSYLDGIEADGGTIRTGGLGDGWVVLPTVVENAPSAARVYREEVFGPVVTITPFDTDSEAIGLANDTRYGLNAMVFTRDLSRAHRASAALRAGTVWVNCFFIRDLRAPFGGVGDSGIGREGGTFSREFFTEPKAVVMQV